MAPTHGTLYVVATPIGNLEDLSPRALRVLAEVDWIACEDTRRTGKLLARAGIESRMLSCHRFNEAARVERVLDELRAGHDVALVSDGGTPGIADPGERLVAAAHEAGLTVSPVPGPNAAVALLSASGLAGDRFVFGGFLPHRAGERRRRLRELAASPCPVVVQESPHRLGEALRDLAEVLGDRPLVLGRELTKLHETILRGSAAELLAAVGEEVRGEIVLAIAPAATGAAAHDDAADALLEVWRRQLAACDGDARRALKAASAETKVRRAELSRRLAELGEGPAR